MMYISKLTALRELKVTSIHITDNGIKHISQSLTSLEILSLTGCGHFITDAGLKSLANLTSIHTLYLACFHKITDNGLKSLSTLTRLHKLDVFRCKQITENGLKSLSSLIALKRPITMRSEVEGLWIFENLK
jgi:Leucine-rich repeat (LRR) protein